MITKSKSCENTFIALQLINSLISYSDNQPINLVQKNKRDKKSLSRTTAKSNKDITKARMRTHMIFNLVERMKAQITSDNDEISLFVWLANTIQEFVPYFSSGRGSISPSQTFDRLTVSADIEHDNSLLKVPNKGNLWRWNHILSSLSLSKSRYYDLQVFNSCLDLMSNLLHFEKLQHKWSIHKKMTENEKNEGRNGKKPKDKGKRGRELIKIIQNNDNLELRSEIKDKFKEYIPESMFVLNIGKIQKSFMQILQLLCKNETEFLTLHHLAVYRHNFKTIHEIYQESNEFRKPLSYEKLFSLINLLNQVWTKYVQKQPAIWKKFAISDPEILKILFKISFKIVEQGAYPCLCLLATAFETSSPTLLENIGQSDLTATLSNPKVAKKEKAPGSRKMSKHRKSVEHEEMVEERPSADVDMEDEETKMKISNLVELFSMPIKTFIEIFVKGKRSKNIQNASMHFVKGLWESADDEYKDKILAISMKTSSVTLISYILREKAKSEKDMTITTSQSTLRISDVFEFVKNSFSKANDLIFSHQNLELYASLYPIISTKKPSLSSFGAISGKTSSTPQNMFIFEREPCMECHESTSEDYALQLITDIKSDMKSNEQSQLYKLARPMLIKEVIINTYDLKGTKRVNEVSIYTNNSQNAELSAIRRDKSVWTFIMTMKVSEERGEKRCRFPVPITA